MLSIKSLILLKKLLKIKTVTTDKHIQKKALKMIEKNLPLFFYKKYLYKNGYHSVLFTPDKSKQIDILLMAHIDVVPADNKLFTPIIKNNNLYGRGAFDMKGPLISLIESINQYYKNNNKLSIGLLITSDEEIGGFDGVGYVAKNNLIIPKIVICPDGGNNFEIITEEKGVLYLELQQKGISAHSSSPWEGKNAANQLIFLLYKILQKYNRGNKLYWNTTANVVDFKNNFIAGNVIPNFAKAKINFRYISADNPDAIINFIKKINKDIKVRILAQGDPLKISRHNKYIKIFKKIADSATQRQNYYIKCSTACDGRFYSSKGIPVIITHPKGGNLHGDNEWISLNSLSKFVDILLKYYQEVEKII